MNLSESQAILMYHAIGENLNPETADPHYTVSHSVFANQLALIRDAGLHGCSVRESVENPPIDAVVNITFDDGHDTNLVAAQSLARLGMTADFFVNPSTIGTAGYLSWAALRDMSAMGMSIQSHGMTHRYMDEQDDLSLNEELVSSKHKIEDELSCEVALLAPPGGRMRPDLPGLCGRAGYRVICNSVAGYWNTRVATESPEPLQLPRLAVLNATGAEQFGKWVRNDVSELARMTRRYRVLQAAKRALGNRNYDAMRALAVRVLP